jgi:hypothetical protein
VACARRSKLVAAWLRLPEAHSYSTPIPCSSARRCSGRISAAPATALHDTVVVCTSAAFQAADGHVHAHSRQMFTAPLFCKMALQADTATWLHTRGAPSTNTLC